MNISSKTKHVMLELKDYCEGIDDCEFEHCVFYDKGARECILEANIGRPCRWNRDELEEEVK